MGIDTDVAAMMSAAVVVEGKAVMLEIIVAIVGALEEIRDSRK